MTRDEMWLLKEKYGGVANDAFERDRLRLSHGEPLAYVIGWVPFLGVRIELDSHPLIPRPETEYWTQIVIDELRTRGTSPLRMLDLCAGSGCIGIALLHALAHASVDLVEIEKRHHPTIRKNLVVNNIDTERARILGGDLFECVTDRYHCILSNPPYVDPARDRTTESVRTFEPHEALYGGTEGLLHIERIISEAPRFLLPHGILIIEHEPEHTQMIAHMAHCAGFEAKTHDDQFGLQRFTRLVLY